MCVCVCVCVHTDHSFHLTDISYTQGHIIYTHMLTHSYTLNVVYSHDDTQKILYINSHLLSDTLNLAIPHTL